MTLHRRAVAAALATISLAMTASAALAHTEVKSTSPARGAAASTAIRAVTVTFTGPIRRGTLRVTRRGGERVSLGNGGRDSHSISRLRVRLEGSLRRGRYRARWTVAGADGHELKGSFGFRLRRG